jgi:hypothetical protein
VEKHFYAAFLSFQKRKRKGPSFDSHRYFALAAIIRTAKCKAGALLPAVFYRSFFIFSPPFSLIDSITENKEYWY